MSLSGTGLPAGAEFVSWREFFGNVDRAQLLLVCLAVWLHAADSLVVATLLPAMVGEIGGQAFVGWTFALYEIGSIAAGAANALLVMRRGLRLPMAAAAALFAIGCGVSALAPAMPEVLLGRVMQGLEGGGFGIAWTFVIRRATALAPDGDAARLAGVIPTVSRLGYALGAAYLGIVANASGFLTMVTAAEAGFVARAVFLSCLPLAAIGFWALGGFMRAAPGGR